MSHILAFVYITSPRSDKISRLFETVLVLCVPDSLITSQVLQVTRFHRTANALIGRAG